MRGKVTKIFCPDIADLDSFYPEDAESFSFLLRIMVGADELSGEESFDIEVVTPKWLMENYSSDELILCQHKIIVFEYNINRIKSRIAKIIESQTSDTWEGLASKISKIALWEFDDYVPY
jgi:hypothetical protein